MNEITQLLEPKEKLIYDSKPNYVPYIISALFASLIFGGLAGFLIASYLKSILLAVIVGGIILFLGIILGNLAYARIHYAITNKRVIIQSGIIGRDFKSIDYDRIQNVSVNVGLLGVIFKVGKVNIFTGEIQSTGGNNSGIQPKYDKFNYVSNPYEVLKQLQTHLSARKETLA